MDLFNRKKIRDLNAQLRCRDAVIQTTRLEHEGLIKAVMAEDEAIAQVLEKIYKGRLVAIQTLDGEVKGKITSFNYQSGISYIRYENKDGLEQDIELSTRDLLEIKFLTKKNF